MATCQYQSGSGWQQRTMRCIDTKGGEKKRDLWGSDGKTHSGFIWPKAQQHKEALCFLPRGQTRLFTCSACFRRLPAVVADKMMVL